MPYVSKSSGCVTNTASPLLRAALGVVTLVCSAGTLPCQGADTSRLLALVRAQQYQDAVIAADQLTRQDPRSADAWFYRGLAENGLGHQKQALDNLQHALTIDPTLLKAAEAGAQIAYRHHDPLERGFLTQVVRIDPTNATAHAMLGVLSLEAGDCPGAQANFKLAGTLRDPSIGTRLSLCGAQTLANAGDLTGAEATLTKMHEGSPADAAVTQALAEVLLQQGVAAKVISLLAPIGSGLSASSLNLLASAYARVDNLPMAIESYRHAIAAEPLQQDNYLDLATLGMEHQSPEVALSVLDSGLKVNPHAARLLVMRGTVYAQVGKNDLAQRDFEQADRLQPNSTYGALGMGVLLREDGNLDEAQAVLEKKLQTTPKNALLSFMLADVLVRKGASPGEPAFARATTLLHAALLAQPDLAPAHALLGKLLLKDGHPEEAITELEAAIRLQPTDRTALNQLVAAYRRVGRTADAARVSTTLEQSVATERAQENEKNRIHLSVAGEASPATVPGGVAGASSTSPAAKP